MLEVIYVVRHGYRMNWVVNASTGEYSTTTPTPTGIPSDPELASYGVQQAGQLGSEIASLDPSPDVIYSSPFYRCLQTLRPGVEALAKVKQLNGKQLQKWRQPQDFYHQQVFGDHISSNYRRRGGESDTVWQNTTNDWDASKNVERDWDAAPVTDCVRVEPGVGEFYGTARFKHPQPAPLQQLHGLFPSIVDKNYDIPVIIPSPHGETLGALHNRFAYALDRIIRDLDQDPRQPRAALIATHAAGMICIGRALTGNMPDDVDTEDFRCGTCALSVFQRVGTSSASPKTIEEWDKQAADTVPDVSWKGGNGVQGGWKCTVNGDCSFLEGGEERTWSFHMEEERNRKERAEMQKKKPTPIDATAASTAKISLRDGPLTPTPGDPTLGDPDSGPVVRVKSGGASGVARNKT